MKLSTHPLPATPSPPILHPTSPCNGLYLIFFLQQAINLKGGGVTKGIWMWDLRTLVGFGVESPAKLGKWGGEGKQPFGCFFLLL